VEFEQLEPGYAETLKRDGISGVIIQARTHEQAEPLIQSGIPAVNVANVLRTPVALPSVFPEDRATGVMAADYFLREKNLRSFAYCGQSDLEYSRLRQEGFCETVKPHPCVTLKRPGEDSSPERVQILKSLPRPVGIFCHNDACARGYSGSDEPGGDGAG
jgi:LacI family transcriptional regulator